MDHGVQEDIEQVMQLISTPGARENEEAPSAALKLSTSSLPKNIDKWTKVIKFAGIKPQ